MREIVKTSPTRVANLYLLMEKSVGGERRFWLNRYIRARQDLLKDERELQTLETVCIGITERLRQQVTFVLTCGG
jgi:hypothetical protein